MLLARFFGVSHMVRPDRVRGELPSSREAYKNLVDIALPSVAEMVLTSLIGSIDTMMVGTIGTSAIASVGLVSQPRMLMLCLFMALNIGVTAVVARRKGEGRRDEANRTLRSALVVEFFLSLLMMALAIPLASPLMRLAGAKDDTIDAAAQYFRILAWMLPFNALTLCINAAQRGVGNTRITLYCNMTANLVNVFFNFLLIGGHWGFPKLGVAGAAYATAIGFGVGFVMAAIALERGGKRGSFLHIGLHSDWRPSLKAVLPVFKVGGNAMFEQIALRFGFFMYARVVADLGTDAFAAHQICAQFLSLSFTFADGVGVAGTSLVGQMMGQKRPDLSTVYGKCSQRLALVISLVLASSIAIFREPLVRLFITSSEDANATVVFEMACQVMLVVALFQPFQMSAVVFSGCLRGAGDNRFVALVMMICVAGIRPLCSCLAVYVFKWGLIGAWLASLIDMNLRLVLVWTRFAGGKWHDIKV